jgi:hypothetical protein
MRKHSCCHCSQLTCGCAGRVCRASSRLNKALVDGLADVEQARLQMILRSTWKECSDQLRILIPNTVRGSH